MAKVAHYYTRFEEDKFYHVYKRSIDKNLCSVMKGITVFF